MPEISIVFSIIFTLLLFSMTYRLNRAIRGSNLNTQSVSDNNTNKELPSVTVCIPARNEKHAMAQCLERVLASDYEKLEIIVFDDSSDDETSILVRSFAHAGVRFVPGNPLPDGWLGRNYALDIMSKEASGTYILFMGVDTYIRPSTISNLVDEIIRCNLDMVSVIPGRNDSNRMSVIFGHLRYFWELVLSSKYSPAASSSFWIIKRRTFLSKLGGMDAFRKSMLPEKQIAISLGSMYKCLLPSDKISVSYEKKWSSQVESSRRLLYPMTGGTWYRVIFYLTILALLNLPFFITISSIFSGWNILHTMSAWFVLAHMALYSFYVSRIWRAKWWLGGLLWPYIIFQELVLFISSMSGYTNGTITWKNRPVVRQRR